MKSDGGIKGFFIYHVEKLVAFFVLCFAGMLFAWGYSVDSIGDSKSPAELQKKVVTAKTHLADETAWDLIKPTRMPKITFTDQLDERIPAQEVSYRPDRWFPVLILEKAKIREDPSLLPPTDLELFWAFAPLAEKPTREVPRGPLDLAARSPMKPKEEPKVVRRPRRPRRNKDDALGDEGLNLGIDDDGGASEAMDPAAMAEDGGGGDADFGERNGNFMSLSKKLVAKIKDQSTHLFREVKNQGRGATPVAKGHFVVGVKAVVPWHAQWEEYQKAFKGAMAYSQTRDTPTYIFFEAMRIDITDDPTMDVTADGAPWKLISHKKYALDVKSKIWAGSVEEISLVASRDESLTMPIPPIGTVDYTQFALHSKVGLEKLEKKVDSRKKVEEKLPDVKDILSPMDPGIIGPKAGREDDPSRGGMADAGDEDERKKKTDEPPVDFKLLRFYDVTAAPGHSYKYKVRVWLNDPNNPRKSGEERGGMNGQDSTSIREAMLADSVVKRLEQQRKADAAAGTQTFWRKTKWSEPSATVTVPMYVRNYYSGSVEPASIVTLNTGERFERTEPRGNVSVSVWDRKYAVNVPVEVKEAQRGTVLNVQQDADVLHPFTWRIHRLEGYEMETDSMVLDLRGGDKLPSTDKDEELKSPGEFLVIDAEGRLIVRDEIRDLETYQMNLFDDSEFGPGISSANVPVNNDGGGMEGMEGMSPDDAAGGEGGDFGLLDG